MKTLRPWHGACHAGTTPFTLMALKGFIRYTDDHNRLKEIAERLYGQGLTDETILIDTEFDPCKIHLAPGDVIVVDSLAEVCRGVNSLLTVLLSVSERKAALRSLSEPWLDMTSGFSNWTDLLRGLSQFGQQIVADKTRMGLSKARKQGKTLGRPSGTSPEVARKIQTCLTLYHNSNLPVRKICAISDLNPRTFYRYLNSQNIVPTRRTGRGDQPGESTQAASQE